ncbi:MAG TPA: hypothetical protein VM121_07525 [Acidimicrobiales bacterium]|nr:hypothetical protein [Acidimicrobiales bacterium]
MTDASEALVEVHIVGLALDTYRNSSAHHDELFREFALVLARPPSAGHEVPAQLLSVIERLNERFSSFTASPTAELQAAIETNAETIDLTYHLPSAVREAAAELTELLARADEYCLHGDLLTVAPPPEAVRFRNWFLGEFVAQINGADPVPWSEYDGRSAPA